MTLSHIVIFSLSAFMLPALAVAQDSPVIAVPTATAGAAPSIADTTPVTRQELPGLIKDALMNNPEMIMEAVDKMRAKQQAEAEKKTQEAVAANKEALYNDPGSPVIGNAKGADITIVEFFDYHCGYCKHMLPVISQLVKDDPKVRVIFKEFPILSDDSVKAARAAIAVNRLAKDKYFAFHSGLMESKGKFDEQALTEIATKAGVDAAAMLKEMAKDDITAELDKSRKLGELLGVRGTPAIVMNDHFLPGAVDLENFKKMIANVRAGRKPDYVEPAKPEAAAPTAAPAPAEAPKQ